MTAIVTILDAGCSVKNLDSQRLLPVWLYYLGMGSSTSIKLAAPVSEPATGDVADVRLAQGGDDDAFARLVQRHQAAVALQMWRFSRDPREHAELVQDVFVNAWRSLNGYRAQGPFLHWLRKIAVRTGYAFWQTRTARQAEVELTEQVAEPLVDSKDSAEAAGRAVHAVLAELPPRDRMVLTLIYLDGHSLAEVAELLGWSLALVKVQAWRARGKLKKQLANLEEWE